MLLPNVGVSGAKPHMCCHAMQKMFAPLDHVDLAKALEYHETHFRSLRPAQRSNLRQGEHPKGCTALLG